MQTDEQPQIKLSRHDLDKCIAFTDMHEAEVKARNAKQVYGNFTQDKKRQQQLQGYLGERAVGLYFDYSTVYKPYDRNTPDVLGYEVRTVKHSNAILITHDEDLEANYICVSLDYKTMTATLKGWSSLQRTLTKSNWQNGPEWHTPCYGMPENQLWPMDTLPASQELIKWIAHKQQIA